jgi:hypothetical protein
MVVLVVHIDGVVPLECERYSPVPTHPHGPSPAVLSLQGMQSQTRETHVAWLYRDIEATQDEPQSTRVLGLDAASVPCNEEPLQSLVPEAADRHSGACNPWRYAVQVS